MIELSGIIILGILAQWLAWRIKLPAILPLILIGLAVGPLSTLWTEGQHKLIEPLYNESTKNGLFPGKYLFNFVSLAIGIILFEGGLTLKQREVKDVGKAILRLITIGSVITFVSAGLGAHFIMGLSWPIAFLFAGLIIVTGPTVIAPILQNVPLNRNVATVLKWEGILIDPIGALVAVLVFEFIRSSGGGMEVTSHALKSFFQVILIGFALGLIAAHAMYQIIKNDLIPAYLLNVFALAFVLGVFVFSDILAHESGLLSVVVMGLILGNMDLPELEEILSFKETLSILLISILFILLAANINMEELYLIVNDWRSFALLAFVVLLVRPLSVLVSTHNCDLQFNEKLFVSWIGPRGIVAAGIASLFGLTLKEQGVPQAQYITPLVFLIVLGTVILNASTARLAARILGVTLESSNGILIVGANLASRTIGKYLAGQNRHVVLVDSNKSNIQKAQSEGMEAVTANIYADDLTENLELTDIGYLIAMTGNSDVNNYALRKFTKYFGEMGSFRVLSADEVNEDSYSLPKQGLLSYTDDYLNLSEVARDYPEFHEVGVPDQSSLMSVWERLRQEVKSIPLFIRYPDGNLEVLPQNLSSIKLVDGSKVVYMGKEVIFETIRAKTTP